VVRALVRLWAVDARERLRVILRPGVTVTIRHPAFPALTGTIVAIKKSCRGPDCTTSAEIEVPGSERIVLPVRYLVVEPAPIAV
jgi:hypothetical protein